MRFCRLTIAVLGTMVVAAAPAAADSYIGVGIGEPASVSGGLDGSSATEGAGGRSGRLAIGQRTGPIALEAVLFGTDLAASGGSDVALVSLGVELKVYGSLAGPLELYGKGGLNRGWVSSDSESLDESGKGWAIGGGLQYTFRPGPLGSAALWLDFTSQRIELSSGRSEISLLNLGVSVGF